LEQVKDNEIELDNLTNLIYKKISHSQTYTNKILFDHYKNAEEVNNFKKAILEAVEFNGDLMAKSTRENYSYNIEELIVNKLDTLPIKIEQNIIEINANFKKLSPEDKDYPILKEAINSSQIYLHNLHMIKDDSKFAELIFAMRGKIQTYSSIDPYSGEILSPDLTDSFNILSKYKECYTFTREWIELCKINSNPADAGAQELERNNNSSESSDQGSDIGLD
jgi:hypothetical protein